MLAVPLALRLAWRDLRGGFGRFTIFIACLALGLAAISAVDTVSHGIEQALQEDGRAILGGDLTVRASYNRVTPEQLKLLGSLGDVSETVTMRGMAVNGDNATATELKAVDDAYPLFGAVQITGGGDVHGLLGPDAALVAPEVLDRLGLAVGQSFKLGHATLRVAGVIAREPDAAGSSGFVLGPRVLVGRTALDATGLVQPGSLVYWTYALRLHPGVMLEGAEKSLAGPGGESGWQVRNYRHAASDISDVLDHLSEFLTLVGVSALIVGGIGIGNAVKAALESRMHAIATMKCIGASRRLVFATYLIVTLAMAAVGTLLGLLLGVGCPLLAGPYLATHLPIAPRLGVNPGTVVSSLAYGVLITLIFALPTLFQAGRVSPALLFRGPIAPPVVQLSFRQMLVMGLLILAFCLVLLGRSHDKELAIVFLFGLIASMNLFAWAGQALIDAARRLQPRIPARAEIKLAVANLHRPGNRTRDMMVSLGMGLAVLIAIGLVETNFRHELDERVTSEAPTFFFLDVQKDQYDAFRKSIAEVPGATEFRATPTLRGRISAVNGVPAGQALKDKRLSWILASDRGITYSAELPTGSHLTEGRWWDAGAPSEPLLSITTAIGRAFRIGPGDHMTLNIAGRDVIAKIANLRDVDWGTLNLNFTLVFAPGTLESAPLTWIATVRAEPGAKREIARDVARRFPSVTSIDVSEVLAALDAIMGKIATAIKLAAFIILATGMLVLLGAVSAGFERRTGDAVVMKVLGATRPRLFRIFLMEYGVLGVAAGIIAVFAGTAAAWWVTTRLFSFPWTFHPWPAISIALLSLAVTLSVGFAATLVVLGRKSSPYLRSE